MTVQGTMFRRVFSLMFAMLLMCFSCVPIYANNVTNQDKANLGASSIVRWNREGSDLAQDNGGYPEGSMEVTVTHPIDSSVVKTIKVEPQMYERFMRTGEKLVVKNQVNDAVSNINIQADTERAQELLGGIHPIVELFCGILVYAIVLGLPIFTGIDLLYITYPVFRNKVQSSADNGGYMRKQNKDGSGGVRFISDEAQYAVENANLGEGKSAIRIYGGKRFFTHIACGIMLFIFLTGNIQIFTNLAVQIVSGIVSVIQGIS